MWLVGITGVIVLGGGAYAAGLMHAAIRAYTAGRLAGYRDGAADGYDRAFATAARIAADRPRNAGHWYDTHKGRHRQPVAAR